MFFSYRYRILKVAPEVTDVLVKHVLLFRRADAGTRALFFSFNFSHFTELIIVNKATSSPEKSSEDKMGRRWYIPAEGMEGLLQK